MSNIDIIHSYLLMIIKKDLMSVSAVVYGEEGREWAQWVVKQKYQLEKFAHLTNEAVTRMRYDPRLVGRVQVVAHMGFFEM